MTAGTESRSCQGPGIKYIGTVSKTKRGRTCQNWNETSPHEHTDTDVGEHNFCRNPDGKNGVWCYTTTKYVRWERCDVPICEDPNAEPEPESEAEPIVTTTTTSAGKPLLCNSYTF